MSDMILTYRQAVILELFADGCQQNDVAEFLNISPDTVKWHLRQAREKLGARNTTHAVAIHMRLKRQSSPHGNPKAQRAATPLTPTLAGSRPTLLQKMSFRIIDAGRRWRITL